MTGFVTFAQNFEDVLLWRTLNSVQNGFYIDVGAADPEHDSVTRAFYDRGWRGINIDPEPNFFEALQQMRPRDTNLCCLVGESRGEADFYQFSGTGLSTTNFNFAQWHNSQNFQHELVRKPVLPLCDIWEQHVAGEVHFLKIDVEGAEASVLRGAGLRHNRPWVILVEAIEPSSRGENWSDWDVLLIEADYRFVWFDGLNRFYVSAERWDELHGAFKTPVNLFDLWVKPRGKSEQSVIEQAQADVLAAMRTAHATNDAMLAVQAELAAARAELAARNETAAAEVVALRERMQAEQHEATALRQRLNAAEANDIEIRTNAELLRAELAAASAELAVRNEAAAAEVVALRERLQVGQHEATTLRRQLIAAKATDIEIRTDAEHLRAELAAAKAKSAARDEAAAAEVVALRERMQAGQHEAAILRRQLSVAKATDSEIRADVERLRAELTTSTERNAAEVLRWQNVAEEARIAIEHLQREREWVTAKIASMRAKFSWRAAAPLRFLENLAHRLLRQAASSEINSAVPIPATKEATPVPAAEATPMSAIREPATVLATEEAAPPPDTERLSAVDEPLIPCEERRMAARLQVWARSQ